jgi:TPP-dependent 2-oxoacid decarboxylase
MAKESSSLVPFTVRFDPKMMVRLKAHMIHLKRDQIGKTGVVSFSQALQALVEKIPDNEIDQQAMRMGMAAIGERMPRRKGS